MSLTVARPDVAPMSFGWADPPYLGCGRLYAAHHPEALVWDDPAAHVALLSRLADEYRDGWAVALHVPSLPLYVSHMPTGSRVGVWCKSFASFKPNVNPAYTWEPMIWCGGRTAKARGGKSATTIRDHLVAPIAMLRGLPGAKPDAYNAWVLDVLGFMVGDTVADLFPGTGSMGREVARRASAPHLWSVA